MVNINEIKTIENAKNAKYNGKELNDSEKKIFDNPLLRKHEKINLDEVCKAAILLDRVKRAEKAELNNSFSIVNKLLNAMNKSKNDNSIAYQVVNSNDEQVDKAISRLENLSKDKNLQGLSGDNIEILEESVSMSGLTITAREGSNNTQGAESSGNIRLKGFSLTNSTITVISRRETRTEEDIQDEISDKEKQLERKNKRHDICEGKDDVEGMEKVEKEMAQLEKEIRELKAELRQAQVQVN